MRKTSRNKDGIKDEILNLLKNPEIIDKIGNKLDINKLSNLIDDYLKNFLDNIKKEKIERFFGRYYYNKKKPPTNFKEINDNFYYRFNYYNKYAPSARLIKKRINGVNPFYISLLRIIVDIYSEIDTKQQHAKHKPLLKEFHTLIKTTNNILNYCNQEIKAKQELKIHKDFISHIKSVNSITKLITKSSESKKLSTELKGNIQRYLLQANEMFLLGIKNQIDENEIINAVVEGYFYYFKD